MYRIQLVGKLKGGGQSVDLIFVGLTSYLQITPTTGFTPLIPLYDQCCGKYCPFLGLKKIFLKISLYFPAVEPL